jgi:DNA-binding NarL/FixJ family response regulator
MTPRGNTVTEHHSPPLRLVWVDSAYRVTALGLKRSLEAEFRVHLGSEPPAGSAPAAVVCCPEGGAGEVAAEVRRISDVVPGAAVVVFVRSAAVELARAAVRAGARGFLHAGMPPQQIARAVSVVAEGELALPRELLKGLLAEGHGPDAPVLGPRQREVLELVAEGLSNAEIARRLYLAESTVKQHLRKAYKILGVKNRREAAVALLRGGVSRR